MPQVNRLSLRDRLWLRREAFNFYVRYWFGRANGGPLVPRKLPVTEGGRWTNFYNACIMHSRRFDALKERYAYSWLPPAILRDAIAEQSEKVDQTAASRARAWQIKSTEDKTNCYAEIAGIVEAELRKTPYSPVVNVGARVDVISEYLARTFPQISFVSVDLQPNLAEHNRHLPQHPNWSVTPGYALDLLKRGVIAPQLVIMSDAACKMTPPEFRAFLDLCVAAGVQAFIFNEAWKPDPMRRAATNYLTSQQLMDMTIPGYFFVHDYAGLLRERGFNVELDELRPTVFHIRYGAHNVVVAKR